MKLYEITNISQSKSIDFDFIEHHCQQALTMLQERKISVWKGIYNSDIDCELLTPHKRRSKNTSNYYTMLLSNLPNWKEYPRRDYSIICTTKPQYAQNYGHLYYVLPFDGANFGICPNYDIFEVNLITDSRSIDMEEMNEVWKRCNFSEDNFQQFLEKFVNQYNGNLMEIRDYCFPLWKYIKNLPRPTSKIDALQFFMDLYDPKRLGFSYRNLPTEFEYNREVWTDSPCYFINADNHKYELTKRYGL
ncbi:Uncharacterised protein [uncultured archaeon]|nr:Uncharacterised protein [uncultured archaeon]